MKIEITDRQHWLERVNREITRIENVRQKRNMEYEDEWATSIFGGRLIRILWPDAKPSKERRMVSDYPSIYAWDVYGTLLDMREGLRSMGTGVIYFGTAEMRAAPPIPQVFPSIDLAPAVFISAATPA
jgi:hypothetical protein